MILVYRVEHGETHVGPYQTDDEFTQKLSGRLHYRSKELPFPGADGLGAMDILWHWTFGCTNLSDLKKWFCLDEQDGEIILDTLKEKGFVLAEYLSESLDVIFGVSGVQVAFDSFNARTEGLVQYHDLTMLTT